MFFFNVNKTKECTGKKDVCPFLLLENSRPLFALQEPQTLFSSSGNPDFLSTCLGIDSLNTTTPPFLLGGLFCQEKEASFSLHHYFLLLRSMVPKLLREHILLTLILRVSDPGTPSNSWRRLWHS